MKAFILLSISTILIACSPATVQICSGESCGTGWIRDGKIQTAQHIIMGAEEVTVYVPSSNYLGAHKFKSVVLETDELNDSANIELPYRLGREVKTCKPVENETVKVYGQDGSGPTRSARTIRKCRVTSVIGNKGYLDCLLENKMSGSPVISKSRKCAIGFAIKSGNNFSIFTAF